MTVQNKYFEGRGSRKAATARVRIYEGSDVSIINDTPYEEVYLEALSKERLLQPLVVTGLTDKVYFSAKTCGGGITGQLDAIVLGLARAIIKMDPSKKELLAKEGLTTRDSREVEKKKYFHIKARKKPQFSKR